MVPPERIQAGTLQKNLQIAAKTSMEKENEEKHEDHKGGGHKVTIVINGKKFDITPGEHLVSELKKLPNPHIPKEETLCIIVEGEAKPLKDHDRVHIKGGEVFASNCPSGGAS